MTRTYAEFDAVRGLGTHELRRLLSEGQPVERAWAGWALALRLGPAADQALSQAASDAPTPGVRTLLITILAGHGERAVVETFARDDPDDDVRAAACRTLAAITLPDDQDARTFLATRFETDASPAVRLAILRLVQDGRVHLTTGLIEGVVDAPQQALRSAAASVLLVSGGPFPEALRARVLTEPDEEIRHALLEAWIARGGAEDVLRTAATLDADDDVLVATLERLVREGRRSSWSLLAPLSDRGASIDARLAELVEDPAGPARTWLLRTATTPLDADRFSPDNRARIARRHAARRRLLGSLGDVDSATLPVGELDMVRIAVVDWFGLLPIELDHVEVADPRAITEEARRAWLSVGGPSSVSERGGVDLTPDADTGFRFTLVGTDPTDLAVMPARELLRRFEGTASLSLRGLELTWSHVPLLALGLALRHVIIGLEVPGHSIQLDWRAREGTLSFDRAADEVRIHASRRGGVGRVDHAWLRTLVEEYLGNLLRELARRYPAVLDNPSFLLLMA